MKITVNKTAFTEALATISPFIARKTTIPILAHVRIETGRGKITLSGTDLDQSLEVPVKALVKSLGVIAVPARKLGDVLKNLKTVEAEDITILGLDNHWVKLICGPLEVKLLGHDPANFPVLPVDSWEHTQTIAGETLYELIKTARHAIATEESRYTLNGALLVIEKSHVRLVATDGHRLTLVSKNGANYQHTGKVIIPCAAIDKLKTLVKDEKEIEFVVTDKTVFFRSPNWSLATRVLEGTYPNYEAVIPKDFKKSITLPVATLSQTIKRVAQFSDERSQAIRLSLTNQHGLTIFASSTETGEASESIQTAWQNDPLAIGFSSEYLLDILATFPKDSSVKVTFRDAQSVGRFEPAQPNGYEVTHVVMPMRI